MPQYLFPVLVAVSVVLLVVSQSQAEPIRLHPDNPHYFLFRGKPTVLVTSGEHYGAVLNVDFDYVNYLDTLAADGLNNTRMFVGAYCEPHGAFKIAHNTLAPAPGRFICPWNRSETPGYANGGHKFDLTQWDESYFDRLRDFITKALERAIIVEVNLFCPFYKDGMWELSPMNRRNNVNDIGAVGRDAVYTLDRHGGLLSVQEAMVRKIVTELEAFDNIYYEIMNEPYIRDVPLDWQRHIAQVIAETEEHLGVSHLISRNVANTKAEVREPLSEISILNFHYASPDAVAMNYGLDRAIGDNETGFKGTGNDAYRHEGWEFMLAGGALYNNLDYSFAVGYEDGTFAYPETQPGGGGRVLRTQLRILKEFIESFDFVQMAPADEDVVVVAEGIRVQALSQRGRQYAIYLRRPEPADSSAVQVALKAPPGNYTAEWMDTKSGHIDRSETLAHGGGTMRLKSPGFADDIALRIVAED